MATVVPIQQQKPEEALERLNRLTGLDFREYPESLISDERDEEKQDSCVARLQDHRR